MLSRSGEIEHIPLLHILDNFHFFAIEYDMYRLILVRLLSRLSCVQPFGRYRLKSSRLVCPWDSPERNAGVDCHALLQGIFPTQVLNPHLMSAALAGGFYATSATWKAHGLVIYCLYYVELYYLYSFLISFFNCLLVYLPFFNFTYF